LAAAIRFECPGGNVEVGGAVDQQDGHVRRTDALQRRSTVEVKAVAKTGIEEPVPDQQFRQKRSGPGFCRDPVAGDLMERREAGLGHDRIESLRRLEEDGGPHGLAQSVEPRDTDLAPHPGGPHCQVGPLGKPECEQGPFALPVAAAVGCQDRISSLKQVGNVGEHPGAGIGNAVEKDHAFPVVAARHEEPRSQVDAVGG
jgi:hypothetical protein